MYLSYFLELFIRITVNDQIFLETGINFFFMSHVLFFDIISANVTGSESETTIQCSDSKSPVTRFIWRFDHSQINVTESEAGGSYTASEEWRPYVKSVSETGSLTLQNLSTDKTGIYTCELINVDETLIKNTFLQITEGKIKSGDRKVSLSGNCFIFVYGVKMFYVFSILFSFFQF